MLRRPIVGAVFTTFEIALGDAASRLTARGLARAVAVAATLLPLLASGGAQGQVPLLRFENITPLPLNAGASAGVQAIALEDVNGDERADLVGVSPDEATVSVFLSRGDGTFETPVSLMVEVDGDLYRPSAVAVADVGSPFDSALAGDVDGNPDIVVAAEDFVVVFTGAGDGSFERRDEEIDAAIDARALALADLDGDEGTDIAVVDSSDEVIVLLNRSGVFDPDDVEFLDTDGEGAVDIVAADFDGDGDLDLCTLNVESRTLSLLLNEGSGSFDDALLFSTRSDPSEEGQRPVDLAVADLDRDGAHDAVVANFGVFGDQQALVRYGPSLRFATSFPAPFEATSIALGDFDGDDFLDLVVAGRRDDPAILVGDNGGGFTTAGGLPVPRLGRGQVIAAGNFAGDALSDLAVLNLDGTEVRLAINRSVPTPTPTPSATPTTTATETPTLSPTPTPTALRTGTATPTAGATRTVTADSPSSTPTARTTAPSEFDDSCAIQPARGGRRSLVLFLPLVLLLCIRARRSPGSPIAGEIARKGW